MRELLGALGAVTLSASTDKSVYSIGDKPKYTIIGGKPGSKIYWTSFKNNAPTGEENAWYGQTIGDNGTAELEGGAWTDADVGRWQKVLLIIDPDDTHTLASVFFAVQPVASQQPATTPPTVTPAASGGGIADLLSGSVSIGSLDVPYWAIGAVALGVIFLKPGRR